MNQKPVDQPGSSQLPQFPPTPSRAWGAGCTVCLTLSSHLPFATQLKETMCLLLLSESGMVKYKLVKQKAVISHFMPS